MVISGQSTKLNVRQSELVAKSPNCMSAECTTFTVHKKETIDAYIFTTVI